MCGIAGIHFKKPGAVSGPQLERFIDRLLLGIESRGGDATGFVSVAPGAERVVMHKEALTATDFIKRRPSLGDGPIRTVLLHTRFATQGHQSNNANNHPVMNGTTFVTHNGHINNDDSIFRDEDIQRIAEVDSEAIAAIINKEGFEKINVALGKLQGGFAIAAVNPIQNPDELILAKGSSSPLIFFENENFITWASTLETLKEAWGDTFGTPPRDYKFRQLSPGDIYMFNGAESEVYQFKVKEYTRYTSYTGTYSGYTGSEYAYMSKEEKDELCFCGHRRFWHGLVDYSGSCMDRSEKSRDEDRGNYTVGAGDQCSCEEYLAEATIYGEGSTFEKCAGCSTWMNGNEMTLMKDGHMLCDGCHEEYGQYFEVYDPDEDPTDNGDFRSCTVVTPTEVRGTTRLQLVPGPEAERRKWQPLAEGDDLLRHNYVLEKVAKKTGYNSEFIEWILFRSEIDIVDQDAWLKSAHEECDEEYTTVEQELFEIEDDLGKPEMMKVVLH